MNSLRKKWLEISGWDKRTIRRIIKVKAPETMCTYFTRSGIPEIAKLARAQRQMVKSRCLFWLFRRFSYRGSWLGLFVVLMFSGFHLFDKLGHGSWVGLGIFAAVMGALCHVHDMIWLAHWRPEIARWIQLHAAEIETAA